MGNCIERSKHSSTTSTPAAETEFNQDHHESSNISRTEEKRQNMKIKIVLTKEELELLMFELENRQGKGLEDVLEEIQSKRGNKTKAAVVKAILDSSDDDAAAAWKPSLDSIAESPAEEMLHTMEER